MINWFILTLTSFTFFGVQGFLTKVAVERGCNSFLVTFSLMVTVMLLSSLFLIYSGFSITDITIYFIFLAIANGCLYSLTMVGRLESLKAIRATIVFPFIQMSIIVVIVWALLFAGETITIKSLLGIVLSLIAIYLLESEARK